MQRTAGASGYTSSFHQLSPAENEASGAHSLRHPGVAKHSLPRAEELPSLEASAVEALRRELTQMQAALAAREQEVERLKQQLMFAETTSASGMALPGTSCVEGPSQTHSDQRSACPQPEPPPEATALPAPREYPVLQRVAVTFGASSLPPPCDRESAPPSQRRAQRRPCEIELEFTEDTHFYAGLTQDISQGGVFVATYHLAPVGTRILLAFDLPDGTHVQTKGEVRWRRENASSSMRPGMGVAFLELDEESLAAIDRFCQDRPPLYMEM